MRGRRRQLITMQHCAEKGMRSIGGTLADTLDDLISSRRIEPQLAIKIMSNFDKAIAQILGEKVKARMSFKVRQRSSMFDSAHSFCLSCSTTRPLSRLSTSFANLCYLLQYLIPSRY